LNVRRHVVFVNAAPAARFDWFGFVVFVLVLAFAVAAACVAGITLGGLE
jgi:hypothetical protein